MKLHDVFTVDQATIDELKLTCKINKVEQPVKAGQQYRISQPPNSVEVRASTVVDNKPQKGRPRRFPTAVVARLMGVPVPTNAPSSDDDASDASTTVDTTKTAETSATPEVAEPTTPTLSDEERARKGEELARAINLPESDKDSW